MVSAPPRPIPGTVELPTPPDAVRWINFGLPTVEEATDLWEAHGLLPSVGNCYRLVDGSSKYETSCLVGVLAFHQGWRPPYTHVQFATDDAFRSLLKERYPLISYNDWMTIAEGFDEYKAPVSRKSDRERLLMHYGRAVALRIFHG